MLTGNFIILNPGSSSKPVYRIHSSSDFHYVIPLNEVMAVGMGRKLQFFIVNRKDNCRNSAYAKQPDVYGLKCGAHATQCDFFKSLWLRWHYSHASLRLQNSTLISFCDLSDKGDKLWVELKYTTQKFNVKTKCWLRLIGLITDEISRHY